jgi:prepilin signal peptidase PulO-like enzyme (type II secretory pathway)
MSQTPTSKESQNSQRLPISIAVVFAAIAILVKLTPHPENFACFGAMALFCGLMIRGPIHWVIPIVAMIVSDCLGHLTGSASVRFYYLPSMLMNYAGFAAMVGVGTLASRYLKTRLQSDLGSFSAVGLSAVIGSLAFFLISNFGSWLDPKLGYETSFAGLMSSYIMGLPFWRPTLVSDLGFSLGFYAVYQVVANVASIRVLANDR